VREIQLKYFRESDVSLLESRQNVDFRAILIGVFPH